MDSRLRPIKGGKRFAGIARTVQCKDDFLTVIHALSEAGEGDVLVVDTMGSTRTVAGELFATEAMRRGVAAIVLDGPCRDTAEIAQMSIPVYITGVRPVSGTANKIYQTQCPVVCGGVVVRPGDVVVGDDDGIVVASRAQMEAIIGSAERTVAAEAALLEGMRAGKSLMSQTTFEEHYAEVQRGNASSKLEFRLGGEVS